jgi:hypothetical protein
VTISALLRDGREQQYPLRGSAMPASATARSAEVRLRLPTSRLSHVRLYGTLCCKHCAIRRGAVYASQLRSAKGRAALQALRLRHFLGGWVGRSPSKPLFMQKRTFRRLITQLRELQAKGRNCQPIKAGHRVIKPLSLYRTQVAAIAAV